MKKRPPATAAMSGLARRRQRGAGTDRARARVAAAANVAGMDAYRALVDEAERDNQGFWARLARETLAWRKPFTQVLDDTHAPFYRWFGDGRLNASFNCLDRHVASGLGERTAIVFEADDGAVTPISYRALLARVSPTGQRHEGLRHPARRPGGDLPAHVGRGHRRHAGSATGSARSTLWSRRLSAKSLNERIVDIGARLLITADEQVRGSRLPLKRIADEALAGRLRRRAPRVCTAAPAPGSTGTRRATPGCTKPPAPSPNTASPNGWTRSIRCSCFYTSGSTGKPRACSTPRPAICCGPRRPCAGPST